MNVYLLKRDVAPNPLLYYLVFVIFNEIIQKCFTLSQVIIPLRFLLTDKDSNL